MANEEHEGNDGFAEWRRRIERKREIVKDYMRTVEDDKLFLVAFLLMRGLDDRAVAKALKISEEDVAAAKGRIALGLQLAGIEVRK